MLEIAATRPVLSDDPKDEYNRQQAMFFAQPAVVRSHMEMQGRRIAEAIAEDRSQICFSLPDRILYAVENSGRPALETIAQNRRAYSTENLRNHIGKVELSRQLGALLTELEQSRDRSVSFASRLLRHVAAMQIVYNLLPPDSTVTGKQGGRGEKMQSNPGVIGHLAASMGSVATSTISIGMKTREECNALPLTSIPNAEGFFLPQWVVLDEKGELLVKSLEEADSCIKSMQRYMALISVAIGLAPYISADNEYIRKRYGMLHQLVNQGRALAIYHTNDIISVIKERAASGRLNRGLTLGLPYFNDQDLRIDELKMEIIPAGLVMFVPAFVVLAVRQEEMKVSQAAHLTPSTRKHLLHLLERIRQAFETS